MAYCYYSIVSRRGVYKEKCDSDRDKKKRKQALNISMLNAKIYIEKVTKIFCHLTTVNLNIFISNPKMYCIYCLYTKYFAVFYIMCDINELLRITSLLGKITTRTTFKRV